MYYRIKCGPFERKENKKEKLKHLLYFDHPMRRMKEDKKSKGSCYCKVIFVVTQKNQRETKKKKKKY